MKIGQVAAVLPSLTAAAPRLAEGAMLFELPVVFGNSGSGAPASDHDATDTGQSVDNVVTADASATIGSITADSATVRQMPSLLTPPVAAQSQVVIAPEAPALAPAAIVELPDPRGRAGTTATKIATGARFAPESTQVPGTEASTRPRPVVTPLAPTVVAEMPLDRLRETMRAAPDISPTRAWPIEQGIVAVPDQVATLPTRLPSANILPTDMLVQSKSPKTPLSQRAVTGEAALPNDAQQVVVGQVTAPPMEAVREIVEAPPNHATIGQSVAVPAPTTNRMDAAPIDGQIAQLRPEPVGAGRQSNGTAAPEPPVDAPPIAIVRPMSGWTGGKSTSSERVTSPKRRGVESVAYPTGPVVPPIRELAQPSGREVGPVGGRAVWQPGHADIDRVAAPAELPPTTSTLFLSGMTRSVDAVSAPSAATLPVLDVDAGGQWLDRLAVEISARAASGGVRLKLSPDNLGELSIAVSNGDSGASVTITAQDEGVRAAIAGSQDRLMAEARAQGVRVVDVQTGLAGESSTGTREHMRQSPQTAMPERFNQPKRSIGQEVANHERANPAGRWA